MSKSKRYSTSQRKTRSKCLICTTDIVSSDDEDHSLQCDSCSKWIHLKCSKVNKKAYDILSSNEEAPFHCHKCSPSFHKKPIKHNTKNNQLDLKNQYDNIISKLDNLTSEIKDLRDFVNFVNTKYDDISDKLKKVLKENKETKKENNNLNKKIFEMNKIIDHLENSNVSKQIMIRGDSDKLKNSDDITFQAIEAAKALGVDITSQDITNVNIINKYKIESKNGKEYEKVLVRVEFSSAIKKTNFMKNKKTLKDLPNFKHTHFFDALTTRTTKLFNYAKKLKKMGYFAVYVLYGKVYVKASDSSKPILLKNESDIDTLCKKNQNDINQQLEDDQISNESDNGE